MAGLFGTVSRGNCAKDLFFGTFYTQHRAQDYCGVSVFNGNQLMDPDTHRRLFLENYPLENLEEFLVQFRGDYGIGSVSVTREPIASSSRYQGGILTFDGNIANNFELKQMLLRKGANFGGYHNPEQVGDIELVSSIVFEQPNFEKGIESLVNLIQGDFAIVCLTKDGIYAARGFGRKPLILGKRINDDGSESYAVSSESTSFINTGFENDRDVNPGETVFIDKCGIHHASQLDLGNNVKFGTFEWVYSAYPSSVIDGKSVSEVRKKTGGLLIKAYPADADLVSPIPNSGRWYAIGASQASYAEGVGIPFEEVFIRYDYAGRSFTPANPILQQLIADMKLIPVINSIKGKRILSFDDSIVRGRQTKNQVIRLRKFGAKEVHARIACPPLMCACKYGKSTKKDGDCIARQMTKEDIRISRGLDTLEYATVEMLEQAIGVPKERLCLDCWGVES